LPIGSVSQNEIPKTKERESEHGHVMMPV
jgi:hypothetical protein